MLGAIYMVLLLTEVSILLGKEDVTKTRYKVGLILYFLKHRAYIQNLQGYPCDTSIPDSMSTKLQGYILGYNTKKQQLFVFT